MPSNSNWESPSPRSRMGVGLTSPVGWRPAFTSSMLGSKYASNRRAELTAYGIPEMGSGRELCEHDVSDFLRFLPSRRFQGKILRQHAPGTTISNSLDP